jgi:hypothetical protein
VSVLPHISFSLGVSNLWSVDRPKLLGTATLDLFLRQFGPCYRVILNQILLTGFSGFSGFSFSALQVPFRAL